MIFPAEFIRAQTCKITSSTLTELTKYGMNTEVNKRGNPHEWAIEFATTPVNEERARELDGFLTSLDGRYETFTLASPLKYLSSTSNFNCNGSTNVGLKIVPVRNLPVSTVKALKIGDYIKFSGHDKCYKITAFTDSDGIGRGDMVIYPRLFASVADDESIGEAIFSVRMTKDKLSLPLDAKTGLYSTLVSAVEA